MKIDKYFKNKTIKEINVPTVVLSIVLFVMFDSFYMIIRNNLLTNNYFPGVEKTIQGGDMMLILVNLIVLVASFIIYNIGFQVSGIVDEYNIFSIKNDKSMVGKIRGSFFLGCGSIKGDFNDEEFYLFYKENEFGLEKVKIKTEGVTIVRRNDIKPSYKLICVEGVNKKFLFVPTNTIQKKIDLNL